MTEVINKYSISECNRCRVRCQSLLSISLSYILETPGSHVRCYLATVSFLDKRASFESCCEGYLATCVFRRYREDNQ